MRQASSLPSDACRANWCTYADAPDAITDQLRSISAEWMADKGLPERGFTLGGLNELTGDGVRCLLAIDADRTVHGVTSWLPVYSDGEVIGYPLDFMRRRADGFRGTMEYLTPPRRQDDHPLMARDRHSPPRRSARDRSRCLPVPVRT